MYRQNEQGMVRPWLLVLLLIVILGGAGYFGWYYYWSQNRIDQTPVAEPTIIVPISVATPTSVISPTPLPTPTATVSSATSASIPADWKNYNSTSYNFNFSYPSNWAIQEVTGSTDQPLQVQLTSPKGNAELGANYTIAVDLKNSAKTLVDLGVSRYADSANFSKSTVTFAGETATEFVYDQIARGATYNVKGIIVAKNNITYAISENSYASDASISKLDQISSSFKFLK